MRNIAVAASLAALFGQHAAAQPRADPITGKASLGYLATSGNTESTSANAAFNLVHARPVWSHEFDLAAVSAETSEETTAESYSAAYEARRDFGAKAYLFAGLDWKSDRFSSYDRNVSQTVGYGRHVVATDSHVLDFEVGLGARQAELGDGTEQDDAILRSGLEYVWTVNETTSFSQDVVIESGSSNTSTEAKSELRARLFGNVALVLSYRIRYNTEVLPGSASTDRFTAVSLEYAF